MEGNKTPPVVSGGVSEASGTDASLIDFEEPKGLSQIFRDIAKPLANLNDPKRRDKPEIIKKNLQHLSMITTENIEHAVSEEQYELKELLKDLAEKLNSARQDIKEIKGKQLGDSHKFERKDKLTPLDNYPFFPASDELFQSALNALNNLSRNIEKKYPIALKEEEYNIELFSSSNAVAGQYHLSADQHFSILIAVLPAYSNSRLILKNTGNVFDLFDLLSISCSKFDTIEGIEHKYSQWKPDFTSIEELKSSLWALLALEYKRDPANASEPSVLFKSIITKLRQSDIPNEAKAKLVNFLKVIYQEDMGITELFSRVLGILCSNFPENKTTKKLQSFQTNTEKPAKQDKLSVAKPVKENKKTSQQWYTVTQNNTPKQYESRAKNPNNEGKNRVNNFVKPWDTNIPYHNTKSANGLSKQINDHFRSFCWKCGHKSHRAKDCKIYTGPIVMDLCNICHQGFHDKCRSKRKGIEHKGQTVSKMWSDRGYPFYPPMMPFWQYSPFNNQMAINHEPE